MKLSRGEKLGNLIVVTNNTTTMSGEILLSASGLTREFNGKRVINDISLTLRAGEVTGLLGPNGAGKSTTLKMLTGVLAPSLGTVSVCGNDVEQHPNRAKQHIGYLPEEAPLYIDLTVDEYLGHCASLKLVAAAARVDVIERAKQRCGLSDVGSRLIGTLSKGYRQRIGIAQAIIHEPAVLILDEPTNGLDPNQIRDVRKLVRELAATSRALIISTHVLAEVQALCDKVTIINQGKLCYSGALASANTNLIVELTPPQRVDFYRQLDGVSDAVYVDDTRVSITSAERQRVCRSLVNYCAQHEVDLVELSNGYSELEQLFFDLTCNNEVPSDD